MPIDFALSAIDYSRFGVRVAKAKLDEPQAVAEVISHAQQCRAEMVVVRVPSQQLATVQRLQARGALLADCLVYFQKKKVETYDIQLPSGYLMEVATRADADSLEALAGETFQGYFGHYHADERLRRVDCDAVYSSWAGASCRDKAVASDVLLLRKSGRIAAFATLKVLNDSDFEGVLFGVSPAHQGKGLYLLLMQLAQNWGNARALRRLLVSTQITNVTVQKSWCRVGMEPLNSFYTLHLWLDSLRPAID